MNGAAQLLREATTINARLVTLPRVQLMGLLAEFAPDAIEFRELQAALDMSDGKLLSNLNALRQLDCVAAERVRVENKTLTAYRLTPEGLAQWRRARAWLIDWLGSP